VVPSREPTQAASPVRTEPFVHAHRPIATGRRGPAGARRRSQRSMPHRLTRSLRPSSTARPSGVSDGDWMPRLRSGGVVVDNADYHGFKRPAWRPTRSTGSTGTAFSRDSCLG